MTIARPRGAERWAWALAAAYALLFAALSAFKRRYYLYDDFDLAIFAQAAAGIARGTLFDSIRGMNWLGDHSSLVLFLLAPITALAPGAMTLLAIQSAALGLAAVPAFRLARRELGDERAALAVAAAFLLAPALQHANLYEFHPETLSVAPLLVAFDALRAGRVRTMTLAAALALLGREDVALVVGAMGLYALTLRERERRTPGWILLGLAAASLALTFGVLKPVFNAGEADFGLLYPRWGGSATALATNLVRHPLRALAELVATPGDPADGALKRAFLIQLLAPLLFLPLAAPRTLLLGLPVLAEHFLSSSRASHVVFHQYALLLVPVVTAAGVRGLANLVAWRARAGGGAAGRLATRGAALALAASLVACAAWGPLRPRAPGAGERPQALWPAARDRALRPWRDALMARVPARGGVAASLVFLDRLAGRSEVHALHHVLAGHLTLSRRVFPTPRGVRAVIADADPEATLPSLDLGSAARMRDLVAANDLRPVAAVSGLSLWLEDGGAPADSTARVAIAAPAPAPSGLVFDGALTFEGATLAPARGTPGGLLTVRARWGRVAPVARLYVAGFVLTDARGGTALAAPSLVGGLLDPVHLWPAGVPVTATDRLVLPRDLAPGRYALGLRLGAWDGRTLALAASDDRALASRRGLVDLGTIEIAPRLAGENHAP